MKFHYMESEVVMKKFEVLSEISRVGVVAVVRAKDADDAIRVSKACLAGGITSIEITFTTPNALKVIETLNQELGDKMLIGAGTVLDSETARASILAGAKYIVSPGFDLETAKLCNRYQIPYMAGCMTITEMITAMEAGTDIIKLFPGSAFGSDFIKAVKGPLPQVEIMPTGGVNIDNVDKWIQNGCVAVGVGSALTKGSDEDIAATAAAYVAKIKETRK